MEGTYSESEIVIQSSSETAARCWDFGVAGFLLLVGNVTNTDLTWKQARGWESSHGVWLQRAWPQTRCRKVVCDGGCSLAFTRCEWFLGLFTHWRKFKCRKVSACWSNVINCWSGIPGWLHRFSVSCHRAGLAFQRSHLPRMAWETCFSVEPEAQETWDMDYWRRIIWVLLNFLLWAMNGCYH